MLMSKYDRVVVLPQRSLLSMRARPLSYVAPAGLCRSGVGAPRRPESKGNLSKLKGGVLSFSLIFVTDEQTFVKLQSANSLAPTYTYYSYSYQPDVISKLNSSPRKLSLTVWAGSILRRLTGPTWRYNRSVPPKSYTTQIETSRTARPVSTKDKPINPTQTHSIVFEENKWNKSFGQTRMRNGGFNVSFVARKTFPEISIRHTM